jgi:glycosyltransferase involved in cell wall biosynthesis
LKKSVSLIIAVYNALQYLEYLFAGLQRQTLKEFEVVIADDGSGPEMKSLVDRLSREAGFQVQHVWQPDEGFRKNAIMNKAIQSSQTDYLVFIDGDCIPHKKFLEDHWTHSRENTVLCGRRVNLSKQMTDRLNLEMIATGAHERFSPRFLIDGMLARSSNLEDGLRISSDGLRRLIPRNHARILGCNFSLGKRIMERINGFDEDYRAPGIGEDTDPAFRLGLIGAEFASLRYLAVLYHLYHLPTKVGEENVRIFERVRKDRRAECLHGLRKN